ncbi:MAG: hypothetical protein COX19_14190 [Desulfobacterales bacterium CG23_combo_of_CG06-09_8_20_14_all_51_8]|nr:MAG: hypothetical protein COX19_14190 [Desulfobacterales bacterium CG23_combo_of_CG06-09_8_20_14_all_51_8]
MQKFQIMSKKNNPLDDYQKLKNEVTIDRVNQVFRKYPDKYIQKMEEAGFIYFEEEDLEKIDEDNASSENKRQECLIAYFEGETELSERILTAYLEERESENANRPLIRKYFKKASDRLKALLFFGLDQSPTCMNILNDLAYFHEFSNILDDLVKYLISACRIEPDILKFGELIQEFYDETKPDGYDALSRLKELFPIDTEKGKTVAFFEAELLKQNQEPDDLEF